MSSSAPAVRPDVVAAGAVVLRRSGDSGGGHEVLLAHRPRYDDWSFPKGKLDAGEHLTTCAVREVEEETGFRITLGIPLSPQRYPLATGRGKVVHYWVGRLLDDGDATTFVPNDEVDEVRWLGWDEARALLSYPYDRDTLEEARGHRRRTRTMVVARHAKAVARADFSDAEPDARRPLAEHGRAQARDLVELLRAWEPCVIATSDAVRCVETVSPIAVRTRRPLWLRPELGEECVAAPVGERVGDLVAQLVHEQRRSLLCSHRPVLPEVFAALGVEQDVRLAPGEIAVVHLRRGRVVALERHSSTPA